LFLHASQLEEVGDAVKHFSGEWHAAGRLAVGVCILMSVVPMLVRWGSSPHPPSADARAISLSRQEDYVLKYPAVSTYVGTCCGLQGQNDGVLARIKDFSPTL
jgi:hypothetical protein